MAGDDAALGEAAWNDSCRWSREILGQRPPATTAVSALAALDHVLADHDLWSGREEYPGLQMLWLLMIAARDYVAVNAPKAVQS